MVIIIKVFLKKENINWFWTNFIVIKDILVNDIPSKTIVMGLEIWAFSSIDRNIPFKA